MAALLSEAGEHLRSSCSRSEAHDDIIVTVTYTLQKSSVHMRSANRYPNVVNHFAERSCDVILTSLSLPPQHADLA